MYLEELRLRHWRGCRSSRTFHFDRGANLIVGANEAGKSSIFEAVTRTLFDRHTSKTRALESVRPLGSTLAPEVELVLRADGRRYRVLKRFLEDPSSQVWVERGGSFELDHEGDRADQELVRLVGGAARGAAKPDQRGLGQALWYLQRDQALPARAWSRVLHDGLSGLMEATLSSELQETVIGAIEAARNETFTPKTGKVRKGSELARLEEEIPVLEGELSARRAELDRSNGYRRELEELAGSIASVDEERSLTLERLEAVRDVLAGATEIEAQHASAVEAVREAQRQAEEIEKEYQTLLRLDQQIVDAEERLAEAGQQEGKLHGEARARRRDAEAHARRWEEDLEPKLDAVRGQISDLQCRLRIEQLEREEQALVAKRKRRSALENELTRRERQLREHAAPDDAEAERAVALAERAATLRERVRSVAIRVGVELEPGVELAVEPEAGETDPTTGELLISRPTVLRLGGSRLTVRGGNAELERWNREATGAADSLARLLERFDVADVEALGILHRRQRQLRAAVEESRARLAEVAGEAAGEDARLLAEVRSELAELRARAPQGVLPGMEGWAEERTLEQIRELERRAARFQKAIVEEREAEQQADQAYRERHDQVVRVGQLAAGLRSTVRSFEESRRQVLSPFGGRDALEVRLAASRDRVQQTRQELEQASDDLRVQVTEPRRRAIELEASLQELAERRSHLEAQRSDRRARIEEVAALDLASTVGDLEGRLETRRRRLEVVRQRGEALKVLHRVIEHHRQSLAGELVTPVAALVDQWLRHVTGERYRGIGLDDELVPKDVQPAGYPQPLPLSSLSYGTYEQVVVLLRLAIARLLSREERQLVILDDRLVDADAERFARMTEVIGEVAETCQILIATCHESRYHGLDARRIQLGGTAVPSSSAMEASEERFAGSD